MVRLPFIFFLPIDQYRVAVLGGGGVTLLGLEVSTEPLFPL